MGLTELKWSTGLELLYGARAGNGPRFETVRYVNQNGSKRSSNDGKREERLFYLSPGKPRTGMEGLEDLGKGAVVEPTRDITGLSLFLLEYLRRGRLVIHMEGYMFTALLGNQFISILRWFIWNVCTMEIYF